MSNQQTENNGLLLDFLLAEKIGARSLIFQQLRNRQNGCPCPSRTCFYVRSISPLPSMHPFLYSPPKIQLLDEGFLQTQMVFPRPHSCREDIESGEGVPISGFGTWSVKEKGGRWGRNPQTEEAIVLAPRTVVTFKCSSPERSY